MTSILKNISDSMLESRASRSEGFDVSSSKADPRIYEILEKNKKKNFVKRILRPDDYPKLDLGGGWEATHLMAADVDPRTGKFYAYPTVIMKGGKLHKVHGPNALRYAVQTGENIEFDNLDDAIWFSKNYKKVWK